MQWCLAAVLSQHLPNDIQDEAAEHKNSHAMSMLDRSPLAVMQSLNDQLTVVVTVKLLHDCNKPVVKL